MSKFNQSVSGKNSIKTENLAGGKAYKVSNEMDLYMKSCSTMLSDAYYKSANAQLKEIQNLVKIVDPEFTSRLAIYAREQMHLRTLPVVLAVELAKNKIAVEKGLVKKTIERVVSRADEIMEILAFYAVSNDRKDLKKLGKLSKQVQKGLAESFNKFNEYQFAKYNRDGEVKLRDAMFLVHPKPKNDEQAKLFKKIAENSLEVPYTWEVELSKAGQNGTSKKIVWEELLDSGKLGFMAMLKNIRNFLDCEVSNQHLNIVGERLSNENEVRKSKQLPFRFLSAYRAINDIPNRRMRSSNDMRKEYISRALDKALKVSIENLELFKKSDNVLLAADVSGSMFSPISEKSTIAMMDIGLLMTMMLKYKCNFVTSGMFGDIFKVFNVNDESILKNVDEMYRREGEVGYSTNGDAVIDFAVNSKTVYDRICIFTDTQMYRVGCGGEIAASWRRMKAKNPNCKLYLFNLSPYGGPLPLQIDKDDVYLISGWSDKVFGLLQKIEEGGSALNEIKSIKL